MIKVVADSPVHLILTDPLGRKTGNDPRIGNDWDDLPGVEYGLEYITAPDGTSTSLDNFLYLALPVDGIYTLEAVGVTSGPYSLILTQTDAMGHLSQTILSGTAQPGSDQTYSITVGPANQLSLPEIMSSQ